VDSLTSDRERAITWKISKLREKLEGLLKERANTDGECESERPWRRDHGPAHTHELQGFEHMHPHEHHHPHHLHHHEMEAGGHPHAPCRNRGRGCRGGGGGRGRWTREVVAQPEDIQDGSQPLGNKWVVPKETWIQFQEAKENLKVARRSGDAGAIKNALEAFVIAKQLKKEYRYPKA